MEVIEETTFAASLGVDLEEMRRTGTGVYYKDVVEGTGTPAVYGTTPTVTFTGWLTDGTQFDQGTFSFLMGNNRVILGFEDGLLGTKVGGTRLMVIPPNRGYGGQAQYDQFGNEGGSGGRRARVRGDRGRGRRRLILGPTAIIRQYGGRPLEGRPPFCCHGLPRPTGRAPCPARESRPRQRPCRRSISSCISSLAKIAISTRRFA